MNQPQVTTTIEVPTEGPVVPVQPQNSLKPVIVAPVNKPGKKDPSKGGRPTDLTDLVVNKLVAAFQRGYSEVKACEYAEISRTTLHNWKKADQEFLNTITHAKNFWLEQAGENITDILMDKSPGTIKTRASLSKWVYEKHMPDEYGQKEPIAPGAGTQNIYNFIPDGKLIQIFNTIGIAGIKAADIIQSDPAAESNPDAGVAGTGEQRSPMVVDAETPAGDNSQKQSVPTP